MHGAFLFIDVLKFFKSLAVRVLDVVTTVYVEPLLFAVSKKKKPPDSSSELE